jgi:hypothetical protein
MPTLKSIAGITAVAAVAAVTAGCSSERYYGPAYGDPYSSPPAYYRTSSGYSYPQYSNPQYSNRRTYDGYWDYQRNYRGIHASPEASSM